ncbi:low molecular weight phosphotyrosine protein phosphatase [Gallaecimonas kandeliae]|uniref:low molecular weight protein-tyrosine-phosphatase n=1 Tax=Gallaecimonas kandeliae TaxID=3029055 RepID=UPI002647FFDC|nr:low molecular weight protein-tyrosine-phosphatase [Gallaecimonas kandeliae]WKE66795.1 low molecular weight phosphotyrosine protein phosphatase [Gallaecimonas kandeliae]
MFNTILVVCVGNICRSPTAEMLLQLALPGKKVHSAGIKAMVGNDMDKQARTVTEAHGYLFPIHSARQLDRSLCRGADLILVMEPGHREALAQMAPEALGKTFLLGKWIGDKAIPDPYRRSSEAFEQVFLLINEAVNAWQRKLMP